VANDFNLAWTIWNQQVTDNANGTSVPKAGMTNFWGGISEALRATGGHSDRVSDVRMPPGGASRAHSRVQAKYLPGFA